MVNTDDFIKRLEIILDYYSINASAFADKIGVQRSSLSHLLSGRNKPSLDFILKILDVYPEVDLYWILNGKGNFPKNNQATKPLEDQVEAISKIITPAPTAEAVITPNLFSEEKNDTRNDEKENELSNTISDSNSNEVEKIVFFYKNGTFKIFTPD
jgi:transcriptional regulator with XRE-family HTH domain